MSEMKKMRLSRLSSILFTLTVMVDSKGTTNLDKKVGRNGLKEAGEAIGIKEEADFFWTRELMNSFTKSPTTPIASVPTPGPTGRQMFQTSVPTVSPTKDPTVTPTRDPTPNTVITTEPTATIELPPLKCNLTVTERRSQILSALKSDVSNSTLLNTEGTPQYNAAEWLIGEDDFYVCPDDKKMIQRYVMGLFYYSTEGPSWTSCSEGDISCSGTSYLSAVNECEWFGSACNVDLCITEIIFEQNNVAGTLPFELENLGDLEVLSLEQGGLTKRIPSDIGELSKLRILDLDFNSLTGPIPETIYNLTSLEQLDLNTNALTGTLSKSVGNLTNLLLLQLYENNMTGTIPTELGNVKTLVIGEFFNNTFTGTMPESVCDNRANPVGIGMITGLTSDCFPNPTPQIECICCTGCAVFSRNDW